MQAMMQTEDGGIPHGRYLRNNSMDDHLWPIVQTPVEPFNNGHLTGNSVIFRGCISLMISTKNERSNGRSWLW